MTMSFPTGMRELVFGWEPHPNHVKSVLMAITFSSSVQGLSSALITLTVPSAATIFSALQQSAIS